MICPSCGHALESGDAFCGSCGASAPAPAAVPSPVGTAGGRCTGCGSALLPDDAFCAECGQPTGGLRVAASVGGAAPPQPFSAGPPPPKRRRRRFALLVVLVLLLGLPAAGLGYLRATGSDRAEALLRAGRYEEAIAWCELLIRLNVTADFWTYANRARALAFLGMHDQAAAEFDRLGRDLPGADATLFGLQGWFFEQKGEVETALRYYDESLRRKPDFARRHVDRGRALALLGQFEASLEAYEEALRLEPGDEDAASGRQTVLSRLSRSAAETRYEPAAPEEAIP